MKILFGLHREIHNEIAEAEVQACRDIGMHVQTSDYGNSGKVTGFANSLKLIFTNALKLRQCSIRDDIDVIYLNTAFDIKTVIRDSITVFVLKFNRKVDVILKIHGSRESTVLSKFNFIKTYLLSKVKLILVLSEEERQLFLSIGLRKNKVRITANALNKSFYKADVTFKSRFDILKDDVVLLFVGRYIKSKGILDLIEACKKLDKVSFNYKLICLGSGPLLTTVRELVSKYELKNVRVLGQIPELDTRSFYSNCDILILPTYHFEGFPMAVFQAVAAGKCIITTKIRAAADHLESERNCLWVRPKDPDDLVDKIIKLSNDECLRKRLCENNLQFAENFTGVKIAENFLRHYQAT